MARTKKGATAAPKQKKQRFEKLRQIYSLAKTDDPKLPLWLVGLFLAVIFVGFLIGLATGHPWYWMFVFAPLGLLAATFFLSKRAEKAAYNALDGRPGAAGAALQGLRRGWAYQETPVAVEGGRSAAMTDAAMVYRAVGRPGVVLIGEGPTGRATKLLTSERRKVQRLTPNVPVTVYRIGSGEGEGVVTPRELVRRMGKLKNTITKHEVTEVDRRLRALGAQRPPIPAGIDPAKVRSMGRGQRR
ncbi:DUF4191 domain-containing protein [Gephyromycinifex aptenodytis]|uniref:DUF4191 domain-containing protein n=1 Tax=Gephyromycinifex aptenodytis TaxID=2716227 RepID=UPI0014451D69|nr:DUF4191 domain-containing protein [Gephyromycinifex aptenodytis]